MRAAVVLLQATAEAEIQSLEESLPPTREQTAPKVRLRLDSKLIDLSTASAPAQISRAADLSASGYNTVALSQLDDALARSPSDGACHYYKGAALSNLGRVDEAVNSFNTALRLLPHLNSIYLVIAALFRFHNRIREAVDYCGIALQIEQIRSSAFLIRANCLEDIGEFDRALRDYMHAAELDPNNSNLRYILGLTYQLNGRLDEAAVAYRETLRIDPNRSDACDTLAWMLYSSGHPEDAVHLFEQGLRLEPSSVSAQRGLALTLAKLKRFPEALPALEEAARRSPEDTGIYLELGVTRYRLGDKDGAIKALNESIQLDPNNFDALASRGGILHKLNRNNEALDDLYRAVHLNPNIPGFYLNLGLTLAAISDHEEAVLAFEHLLELDPNNLSALYNLQIELQWLGRNEEALECLDKALRADPNPGNLLESRDQLYRRILWKRAQESTFPLQINVSYILDFESFICYNANMDLGVDRDELDRQLDRLKLTYERQFGFQAAQEAFAQRASAYGNSVPQKDMIAAAQEKSAESLDDIIAREVNRSWLKDGKGKVSPAAFIREVYKLYLDRPDFTSAHIRRRDFKLANAYAAHIRPERHPEDDLRLKQEPKGTHPRRFSKLLDGPEAKKFEGHSPEEARRARQLEQIHAHREKPIGPEEKQKRKADNARSGKAYRQRRASPS